MRWALGAAVALLAAAVAIGVVLVRAPSGEGRSSILVALINGPKVDCLQTRVVRADRTTLNPIENPAVRVKGAFEQPVYSPDRKQVALGGNSGTLVVVDATHMHLTATVRVGPPGDDVHVIAWPAADRLVAVSFTARVPRPYVTRIVAVDPSQDEVVSATSFPSADAWGPGATRSGVVPLLVVSRREIAPPRLAVVGAQGRLRTVALGRMHAGSERQTSRSRFPGFAVDPRGEQAFVVSPSGLVAIVQLGSLDVRYRQVGGLEASPPKKVLDRGRSATWLGAARIGVSGSDSSLEPLYGSADPYRKEPRDSFAPFGLRILDIRRWTVQTLDRRPSTFEWMRDRLIAYGRSPDAQPGHQPDETVVAFDRSGRRAYTVHGDRNTYWQAFDGRLFLFNGRSRLFEVRDARDGQVLGHVAGESLRSLGPC